jgi:hypothetical protein
LLIGSSPALNIGGEDWVMSTNSGISAPSENNA